jgi:hypothetical protein
MQKELTIKLNDEVYDGLMNLVGEQNAGQFIESVLRPYVTEPTKEYEVKIPLNNGKRKIYLRSPRLKNPADAAGKLEIEIIREDKNA